MLSIEGSALRWHNHGVKLFVSSEKTGIGYPEGLEQFLKPGAGVWTIERLHATSMPELQNSAIEPLIDSARPGFLHVKDPVVYPRADGDLVLLLCTHPYCWSSSNTAYAIRHKGSHSLDDPHFVFFPRGGTWPSLGLLPLSTFLKLAASSRQGQASSFTMVVNRCTTWINTLPRYKDHEAIHAKKSEVSDIFSTAI